MSGVWIDTDRSRAAARTWQDQADDLHRTAIDLERRLHHLALGRHVTGPSELTAAASELWVTSSFARLVAERADRGDASFDPSRPDSVASLRRFAGADVLASLTNAWGAPWATPSYSSIFGDRGETGDREVRTPWGVVGSTPVDRARNLVIRALVDTGDERQIRVDEFEVVRLDNGKYVVVLPGVTDLSDPDPGWNEHHQTARDLDQAAFRSSRSSDVADNVYAQLVRDGLRTAGVPLGADLMIVGHSFGADTALDLAADTSFNGPDGYRVSHVIAAAYHSGPQLAHVPAATQVLVLQNSRDAAVIAETVGDAHVAEAVVARAEAVDDLLRLDVPGAAVNTASSFRHDIGSLWEAALFLGDHLDEIGDVAGGAVTGDLDRAGGAAVEIVTIDPGVSRPAPGQVVDVFVGGGEGFGHHQRNYVDHVDRVGDDDVVDFLVSLDRAGYAVPGVALAVDVSVPPSRR